MSFGRELLPVAHARAAPAGRVGAARIVLESRRRDGAVPRRPSRSIETFSVAAQQSAACAAETSTICSCGLGLAAALKQVVS
jgi:hypothetical protein